MYQRIPLTAYREEALEEKEVREAWRVEQSAIWRPRLREADSRGFWDTPGCRDRMFEADWARACNKEKFATMMARENKNSKVGLLASQALCPPFCMLCDKVVHRW